MGQPQICVASRSDGQTRRLGVKLPVTSPSTRQRQSGGSPGPSHESVYSLPSEQSLSPTSQRNGPPSTLAPPYVASQTTCPTESKQSVSSAVMSHGWSAVSSVHED